MANITTYIQKNQLVPICVPAEESSTKTSHTLYDMLGQDIPYEIFHGTQILLNGNKYCVVSEWATHICENQYYGSNISKDLGVNYAEGFRIPPGTKMYRDKMNYHMQSEIFVPFATSIGDQIDSIRLVLPAGTMIQPIMETLDYTEVCSRNNTYTGFIPYPARNRHTLVLGSARLKLETDTVAELVRSEKKSDLKPIVIRSSAEYLWEKINLPLGNHSVWTKNHGLILYMGIFMVNVFFWRLNKW